MMEKKALTINFEEYESTEDLREDEKNLVIRAREAAFSAYAPYSRFYVGAAVLLENGEIVIGSNQENAAYPSGLCAERVALFAASAQQPGIAIKALAVTARSGDFIINTPVTPCGSCRQVISEYEQLYPGNIRILITGETGKVQAFTGIASLLPLRFDASQLNRK
jgi:cytidine deaminase